MTIATIIFSISLNSALMESKVVKVPVPAINGNAIGTMLAVAEELSLKKLIPNIISNPIKNKISEPAIAKSLTVMPIRFKILSPTNKNTIMITPETHVALKLSILPILFFRSINTGKEPTMSITANKIMVMVRMSLIEKFMGICK